LDHQRASAANILGEHKSVPEHDVKELWAFDMTPKYDPSRPSSDRPALGFYIETTTVAVKPLLDGLAPSETLFVRMGVRCRRMFVSLFAMLLSRRRVVLSVLVLAARMMMLSLVMMMRCSVVMSGRVMMMLLRGMLR
jgi:hypothetical protein